MKEEREMSIAVKAYCGHEARRVTINKETTLGQFKQLMQHLFGLSQEVVQLQYVDDEDEWVKVSSEHEWQEAMRIADRNMSSVLKVKIGKQRRDAKTVLADFGSQCKTRWDENVAPRLADVGKHLPDVNKHMEDWGKRLEDVKNDPRTKQLQQNVEQFASDLVQFLQKQERELPQTVQNYLNQFLSLLSIPPTQCFQQSQPETVVVNQQVPQQPHEPQQSPAPPAPMQQELSASLTDFVIVQNELAESVERAEVPMEKQALPQLDDHSPIQSPIPSPPPPPPAALPAPVEKEEAKVAPHFEYQIQADLLVAMGFTNKELNEQLLRKFKGDVARTVDSLFV